VTWPQLPIHTHGGSYVDAAVATRIKFMGGGDRE